MRRIILGVIAGFVAWFVLWLGAEQILSSIWPDWFGAHQIAFQAAIENGGPFTADSTILVIHIVGASIISVISGLLAALIAGENKRTPLVLGLLLTASAVLKAVMSWPLVPVWYHVLFTAVLLPMTMVGGKLRTNS